MTTDYLGKVPKSPTNLHMESNNKDTTIKYRNKYSATALYHPTIVILSETVGAFPHITTGQK